MEINGFSALVSGGASGLGEATSRLFAEKGARVVVMDLDRQQEKGDALAKELGGIFCAADVTDAEQVQAGVDAAVEMAPLRAMVNCAGVGMAGRTIDREGNPHDLDVFKWVLDINLTGTFNCIRLGASAMNKNDADDDGQRGAITNTASVAAYDGQIGQAAYSASKGGVVGMTLTIARDLAAAGIRVNTIAPGLIDTPIYGEGEASEAFKAKLGESVLFPHRLGTADEFASLALELTVNNYMNAQDIRIDGGIRMPPK
jgi:NAD(P)-dependent dehydrogenase (short-subunit alcohol dehydrogenase family)